MHLVIAGPYEVLYTTAVDIWSFGCLLLNMLIGKCGPLKQRGVSIYSSELAMYRYVASNMISYVHDHCYVERYKTFDLLLF